MNLNIFRVLQLFPIFLASSLSASISAQSSHYETTVSDSIVNNCFIINIRHESEGVISEKKSFLIKISEHLLSSEISISSAQSDLIDYRFVKLGRENALQIIHPSIMASPIQIKINEPEGELEFKVIPNNSFFLGELKSDNPFTSNKSLNIPTLPPVSGEYRFEFKSDRTPANLNQLSTSKGSTENFQPIHDGELIPVNSAGYFILPYRESKFAPTDSVFLKNIGTDLPLEMQTRDAFETLSSTGSEVSQSLEWVEEQNTRYERLLNTSPGNRYVFHRVAFPAGSDASDQATITLPISDELTTSTITIGIGVWGYQDSPTNPDHHVKMSVEGIELPLEEFEGRRFKRFFNQVQLPEIPLSNNELSITHRVPSDSPTVLGGSRDIQFLDEIKIFYEAYPRISDKGTKTFEVPFSPNPKTVTVGGFPQDTTAADILLLELDESGHPIEIINPTFIADSSGTLAVEFEVGSNAKTLFVQHLNDTIQNTSFVLHQTEILESSEELESIQTLLVAPKNYHDELVPLIQHRGDSSVRLIVPQAAYNHFNGGQQSAEALREALQYYYQANDTVETPAILLVGTTSFDPVDYTPTPLLPTVPAFVEQGNSSEFGNLENLIDYPFALLSGADEFADATVGRWHARSETDVETIVQKQILYEQSISQRRSKFPQGVFVSGRNDESSLFADDQDALIPEWQKTGLSSQRITVPDGDISGEQQQLFDLLESESGVSFLLYTGHGNTNRWGSSRIIQNSSSNNHLAQIDTGNRWPFVATFTCFNGFYGIENQGLTLSESWLFEGVNRGAIANISPVSVDHYENQSLFSSTLIKELSIGTKPITAGQLLINAQIKFRIEYPQRKVTSNEYVLFGDPSTPLSFTENFNNIWSIH